MLLVYALTRAAENSWTSTETIVLLAGSVVLIAAFVLIETRSPAPLLPLRMFRLRTLAGSNLSGVFSGVSFVVFFLGSLYAQLVLDYSAIETGAAFLAASLSIVPGSGIAQSLIGRVGVRPVVPTGFAVGAVGLVLLAQARSTVTTSPICSRPSWCSGSGCRLHSSANRSGPRVASCRRTPGSPPG